MYIGEQNLERTEIYLLEKLKEAFVCKGELFSKINLYYYI